MVRVTWEPSPEARREAARVFSSAVFRALDAGEAAWAARMAQRDARPRMALPAAPMPLPPTREQVVRQYWRFAASVYPNGVPPGFELCRAFKTEWSPW